MGYIPPSVFLASMKQYYGSLSQMTTYSISMLFAFPQSILGNVTSRDQTRESRQAIPLVKTHLMSGRY